MQKNEACKDLPKEERRPVGAFYHELPFLRLYAIVSGQNHTTMSQNHLIKLSCSVCKNVNYYSTKNRKSVTRKIELKKLCKHCKKVTIHKEAKK